MRLPGFTITQVIYSRGDTAVVRAIADKPDAERPNIESPGINSDLRSATDSSGSVGSSSIIKYQNTDYPSVHLDARWKHEFEVLQSISSDLVIKAKGLKCHNNTHMLILEDFSAVTLTHFIQSRTLTFTERLQIACQLVAAVADVHKHDLIHRDINPHNILINPDSLKLKLCDFALATRLRHKLTSPSDSELWGTFEYISPEQTGRTGLELDYRSDYYSMGITLYELFSGRLPFISGDAMTLLHCHIARDPELLITIQADTPYPISAIVAKLLAKSPEDRYQSSFGLQADVDNCWQQWQKTGVIKNFLLASSDIQQKFCISHKLYGREKEVATLLRAFNRVSSGQSELVMISGYSGVGKSALVQELQKPNIAMRGFFITGKCDQYNRSQPYTALIQAFKPLIQQLLSEPEERLGYWREKLTSALGDNAAVIVELLPNLALITGLPPALSTLPAAETETRFLLVCSQLINALCSRDHPLVIFLDDLQWADIPMLSLLEHQLCNHPETALLVVAAYRSNEVDESHPLTHSLRVIAQGGTVQQLHLKPLKTSDVEELLADTFQCSVETTMALAELCVDKTYGNPFFLNQFLAALYDEGDISYNHLQGRWIWRIEQIQNRAITENVVDLMVKKLRRLSSDAQSLLALAAHLGNQFTMRQLASVLECDVITTAAVLWPVLKAGVILPLDEHFEFANDVAQLNQAHYRFLHDRVQQAAYQLTPEGDKQSLQLRIGRHLLANSTAAELEDNPFTLLQALNNAASLITDEKERAQLVTLNLHAGIKVKKAAAYQAATIFLNIAKNLLPESAWTILPEQTFSVHKELAEAEYLAGNFAAADALYVSVIEASPSKIALITLSVVQAEQYQIQGRFNEAIPVLLSSLQRLGQSFPENESAAETQLIRIFSATQTKLSHYSVEQLLTTEKMSNAESLLCMKLHNALAVALYLVGHFKSYAVNACKMVELTLKHGQCELSSIGYLTYATAMSSMGEQYSDCYQMGKLAKTMSDQWENKYYRATTYQYFASTYQHWCEPIENSYSTLAQVVTWGREGINLLYAGYSLLFSIRNQFIKGVTLGELAFEATQGLGFLRKSHQIPTVNYVNLSSYQALLALQGKTLSPNSLDTETFNANDYFNGDFSTPSMDLAFYSSAMIRHAYLIDDAQLQQQFVQNLPIVSAFLPDSPSVTETTFYAALCFLNVEDVSEDKLVLAQQYSEQFKLWALDCPQNFEHKHLLISAEIARVVGDNEMAMRLYEHAINAAEVAGFFHCQALACERYAKFWLSRGQRRAANSFIKEAYHHYSHWGASAKCELIETQWSLLQFNQENIAFRVGSDNPLSYQGSVSASTSLLDFHSLLKANQLLSQEVNTGNLLKKMMEILLENAGAQQGGIVVNDDDILTLEVFGRVDSHRLVIDCQLLNLRLDDVSGEAEGEANSGSLLPDSLVRYVQQTRETLLLDKPAEDQRFLHNSYLRQHNPKSVLCLPIIGQGRLIAIVYLENNLTEKTFTKKHKDTLDLIAAQAAVSLVNARHYGQLEEKVRQRTEELRRLASTDALTGVANRREFDETLEKEWRRSQRDQHMLSLLMIDIDHFKQYNDHYGHPVGDKCIHAVAQALQTVVNRSSDLVARYGGEEFVILITGSKSVDTLQVAQYCIDAVRALAIPHAFSSTTSHVTVSLGICSMVASPGVESDVLISRADKALYNAKHKGRNQYCFAD